MLQRSIHTGVRLKARLLAEWLNQANQHIDNPDGVKKVDEGRAMGGCQGAKTETKTIG